MISNIQLSKIDLESRQNNHKKMKSVRTRLTIDDRETLMQSNFLNSRNNSIHIGLLQTH
jgi:hypothetical protein